MTDKKKYIDVSVIQAYVEGSISLKHASIMLECTPRTIKRMAAKYPDFCADGLIHGNTGKESHNKIDSLICQEVLDAMNRDFETSTSNTHNTILKPLKKIFQCGKVHSLHD